MTAAFDPPDPPRDDRDVFAALRAFMQGYLHEDIEVVHGSASAAMDAFIADAGPSELAALARAWAALRVRVEPLRSHERLALLRRLGLVWRPGSWDEVERLFEKLDPASNVDL